MLMKWIGALPVFVAAIASQLVVFYLFLFTPLSFLWYNVAGCFVVIAAAMVLESTKRFVNFK